MKLIFAGTPPFAARALAALHAAGHEIALVLTQPDRPAGRGLKLMPSAVAVEAARLALPVEKPASLKTAEVQAMLKDVGCDVMVVAAYGLLLPEAVLKIPDHGCINIHGSLLPRWRGAAPVQRAIEAGDTETGIAIMQMDIGLDTGPVLLERRVAVAPDETSATLFSKLAELGAAAIVDALQELPALTPAPQPGEGVTYAKKIDKAESKIDWGHSADELERRMRAFDPFPGCETGRGDETLKIWRAVVVPGKEGAIPGTVIQSDPDNLIVQCGRDALSLKTLQKPGGKRLNVADFQRGAAIASGTRFS